MQKDITPKDIQLADKNLSFLLTGKKSQTKAQKQSEEILKEIFK
jgi:hypothetical protein